METVKEKIRTLPFSDNPLRIRAKRNTVPLYVDKKQIINLFLSLNEKDKFDAFNQIKSSVFINRFDALKNSLQSNELTIDDIAAEVKAVRKERYERGRQCA